MLVCIIIYYICRAITHKQIKTNTMEALTVKSAHIYNNCQGKLNIQLSDKTAKTANLLHQDLVSWLKKEVSTMDLVKKYFNIIGDVCLYSNPKN